MATTHPPDVQLLIDQARATYKAPPLLIHLLGLSLAMCGGMINTIAYLDLSAHSFVSHLTGTSTKIGMRLAGEANTPSAHQQHDNAEEAATTYYAVLLVVFFFMGSCTSGCLIARNAVTIGRSAYGVVMLMMASLLIVSMFFDVAQDFPLGGLLVAMSCGMQNAMVTTYAGAVVRTTHVTGTFTDLGLLSGRMLSNFVKNGVNMGPVDRAFLRADFEKWRILFCLLFGFIFGCYFGTVLHIHLGDRSLMVPAGLFLLAGVSHLGYVVLVLKRSVVQQAVQSASHKNEGTTSHNVMLYVDGDVYDLNDSFSSEVSNMTNLIAQAQVARGSQELKGGP